jgi:hypothetical protein
MLTKAPGGTTVTNEVAASGAVQAVEALMVLPSGDVGVGVSLEVTGL